MVCDRSYGVACELARKGYPIASGTLLQGAKAWPWFSYHLKVVNVYARSHSSCGNKPSISDYTIHGKYPLCHIFTVAERQVACWYFPSMIAHCYLPLIVHLCEAGKKIRRFCFWISKIFVTLHLWKVAGRSWGHGTEEHVAWVWHRRQHRWNKKNICNGIYVKGRLRQTRIRT